jgi:hypothetical protein
VRTDWTDRSGGINFGWTVHDELAQDNVVINTRHGIDFDSDIPGPGLNTYSHNLVYNGLELMVLMSNSYGDDNYAAIDGNVLVPGPVTVEGVWCRTSTGNKVSHATFTNNIVGTRSKWFPAMALETDCDVSSDNNVFFSTIAEHDHTFSFGGHVYNGNTWYASLADWQKATMLDAHSTQVGPGSSSGCAALQSCCGSGKFPEASAKDACSAIVADSVAEVCSGAIGVFKAIGWCS